MPDHNRIYQTETEQYERLIACQPNLAEVVEALKIYEGLEIIDLGAGTGRLACVLAEKAKSILLLDESAAMLQVAASKLTKADFHNWQIQTADHRAIPVADQSTDLVVSGWSICYLASSKIPEWRQNVERTLREIQRVLRPGGTCIIFETLGTGFEMPTRYEFLRAYYDVLEQVYGFKHKSVRMDYQFTDVEEAEQLSRFFFGDETANKVVQIYGKQLPEYAGVWWRAF